MTMTGAEDYLKEIIRLQLKKPRSWNWELSTSKSSPHIALPTIQLYDTKGQLLVETNDNGSTNRQSWNSSQNRGRSKDRESTISVRNPVYLQRCRSDNLEKRMAQYRASTRPTLEIEATEIKKQPKTVKRCLSNTIVVPSLQINAVNQSPNSMKICRSRSKEAQFDKLSEKYNKEKNEKSSGGSRDWVKSNKGNLGKFGQLVEGMKNDKRVNEDIGKIHRLQKSRSDVLDIKVKSKVQHTLSDKQPIRPYHRRSDSDDLIQKTRQKYNIKESLKRAEHDGYKNFIYAGENLTRNYREKSMEKRERSLEKKDTSLENGTLDNCGEKKRRLIGCLATAETVLCNNKPINFEINNVVKPKRYRLRQSRAGTLVISDESFSSSHRRRCHGDFGDCRTDSNDIIINEDDIDTLEDIPIFMEKSRSFRYRPQRSRSEKDKADVRRTLHNISSNNSSSRDGRHFRQSSDPAGVKTAKFPPNRYRRPQHTNDVSNNVERTDSTRETFLAKRNPKQENSLFQSKSDVFLFQTLFNDKSSVESDDIYGNENRAKYTDINDNALTLQLDDNCNYIVQEPLTTPGSESDNKNICDSIRASEHLPNKIRTKVKSRHSDGSYPWITRNDSMDGSIPLTIYGRQNSRIVLNQSANMLVTDWINQVNPNGTRYKEGDPAYSIYAGCARSKVTIGTRCTTVVWLKNNRVQLVNITIENSAIDGQAVALRSDALEIQLDSLRLLGHQDTFYIGSGCVSVNNSYLEGDTDYVFGEGTAVFHNCIFKSLSNHKNSSVIFAPKTDHANKYGFLVVDSIITSDDGFKGTTQVKLGRPWDSNVYIPDESPNGQLLIRNCRIDAMVNVTAPWGQGVGSGRNFSADISMDRDLNDNRFNRFWEYGNYGDGAQ